MRGREGGREMWIDRNAWTRIKQGDRLPKVNYVTRGWEENEKRLPEKWKHVGEKLIVRKKEKWLGMLIVFVWWSWDSDRF